ncbi:unnamed protein product [Linum trigynum]|uniref:Uncharacterized protein n=1 Tax=Linum trigynum TaxID=586398 RepID=A0AAV2E1X9_9ROSI
MVQKLAWSDSRPTLQKVFTSRRSEAVLRTIHTGALIKKRQIEDYFIPIGLVENSGRCNKNESDEKVLPNRKLIDGSGSNVRGKLLIPNVIGVQWLIVELIKRSVIADIAKGGRSL